jgi:C1A family cysteine protease
MNKHLFRVALTTLALAWIGACTNQNDVVTPSTVNQSAAREGVEEGGDHTYGALPSPQSERDKIPFAPERYGASPNAAATVLTLTTPPIGDQGQQGSCVGWCTAYTARSQLYYKQASMTSYSPTTDEFSPAFVYDQIKVSDCNSGSYTTDALKLLKNQGVCLFNSLVYTDKSCTFPADPTGSQLKAEAANYKINGYNQVSITTSAIKAQLQSNNAVVVAGPVDINFERLGYNKVLKTYNNRPLGGHCYAVVGYDDNKQAFLIQNQWGTSWATNGFGYIAYSLIGRIWQEAYVIY